MILPQFYVSSLVAISCLPRCFEGPQRYGVLSLIFHFFFRLIAFFLLLVLSPFPRLSGDPNFPLSPLHMLFYLILRLTFSLFSPPPFLVPFFFFSTDKIAVYIATKHGGSSHFSFALCTCFLTGSSFRGRNSRLWNGSPSRSPLESCSFPPCIDQVILAPSAYSSLNQLLFFIPARSLPVFY